MKKICIVDDYDINLFVLEEYLKEKYNTVSFNNAKDCIDYLRTNETDLVLMDLNMPNLNGLDASEILKHENPSLKIIIITAHVSEKDLTTCIKNKISDVLVKPIFKQNLIEKINLVI
jgi:CheY-like chemotaxis protein